MSEAARSLLPTWHAWIDQWSRQLELMESGQMRVTHNNVDMTPEAIQTILKQRDDLIALIKEIEADM